MARIFISYRRQDSAYPAGILRDALQARFGADSVFFDLDNIPFGVDFRQYIGNAVGQCDVLLVMIGDQWLQLKDDQGRRRIEDLSDYVRIEIESALKRDIPVVPVLVEEAKMPGASELPESIRDLAYRNAAEIGRGRDQKHQIERLVSDLERNWPAKVSDAEEEKLGGPEEEKPSAPEPRKAMARPRMRKSTNAKVASSLNLRTLFSFPDPSATAAPSNEWQAFQSRLGREIKTIKWLAAMPDLASKVGELFNVELPDLLVSSWEKARELQGALEESRKSPEEVIVLDLAEHEITNEYHPSVEIRIAGMPLPKKIEFKVQIATALKGINLKIQAGTITEIQAGSCDFEGKIKYEDLTIAEKKVGPIELLGVSTVAKQEELHEVVWNQAWAATAANFTSIKIL